MYGNGIYQFKILIVVQKESKYLQLQIHKIKCVSINILSTRFKKNAFRTFLQNIPIDQRILAARTTYHLLYKLIATHAARHQIVVIIHQKHNK